MSTFAVLAYRVDEICYSVLVDLATEPAGLGNQLLQTIPRDPLDFNGKLLQQSLCWHLLTFNTVWVTQKTAHFQQEGKRLGLPDSQPATWEPYFIRPGVGCYHPYPWTCIVDLDKKQLTIHSNLGWDRQFKLGNLPFQLPEHSQLEELLHWPIPLEFLHLETPENGPNIDDISRFSLFRPSQEVVMVLQPVTQRVDPWTPLGLFVLDIFVERYRISIGNLSLGYIFPYIVSHGNDDMSNPAYQYRQLAYAVLNLCQPAGSLLFSSKKSVVHPEESYQFTSWTYPETSEVWIGDIPVLIVARISIEEFLHAAIGKAIDLLTRAQQRERIGTRTAVIFAIHALVIVSMREPELATDGPIVTFSQALPVLPPSELRPTSASRMLLERPTTGLSVLMNLFGAQQKPYLAPLPVEICTQIHEMCDFATRKQLAATCRAFRVIDTARPRIDGWELLGFCNHGNRRFFARAEGTERRYFVELQKSGRWGQACQIALFRGADMLLMELPWLSVAKLCPSEKERCACIS